MSTTNHEKKLYALEKPTWLDAQRAEGLKLCMDVIPTQNADPGLLVGQTSIIKLAVTKKTTKYTYGYIWSTWLYQHDKDHFMINVYNACKDIDECVDTTKRAAWLTLLRDKVQHSNKPWVEGIIDFIDFESTTISSGKVSLDILADNEDCHAMAILDGAYRHGAFRGLCRTASGAEWIGLMGEWCAAALHQGLKGMRLKKPVSEWELPILGEAWCKGIAIWALVCLYMTVDQAGDDPDNDQIIARIHTVIGAHHMAGVCWLEYRGEHPHRWFNSSIRGVAPCQQAIRRFGEKHAFPTIMIDIMCRAADHVNQWINPAFNSIHLPRTRGLLLGDHTPRLSARLGKIRDEMIKLVGDMTAPEVEEYYWRSINWICSYTTVWRGRGDYKDIVLEVTLLGALLGVLRESRGRVTPELLDRIDDWTRQRLQYLPHEQKETILSMAKTTMRIRGRLPGSVNGYSSTGLGHTRFMDGVWTLSVLTMNIVTSGGCTYPPSLIPLVIQFFNELKASKPIKGVDVSPEGDDAYGGCPVCLPSDLFIALVDNQLPTEIWHVTIWGSILYNNLGLGLPNDVSMGCVKHEE